MAFKIAQKIKPLSIQDKTLDMTFMAKYLKGIQKTLLTKTSPEQPTDYFYCSHFSGTEDLLIFGTQAPAYRKIFKETAKGKHGFEKEKISIGKCYIVKENQKNFLCIQHNKALSKGKKAVIMRSFRKILRSSLKGIKNVRWIEGNIATDEQGEEVVENVASTATDNSNAATNIALISREEIQTRAKQIKQGIDKLKNDVFKRYKKNNTSPRDADFIASLRKAANVWVSKLTQTDERTANKLDRQRENLEKQLPQWAELEENIRNSKSTDEVKAELKNTVKELNIKRERIKELLKRVNLKAALS